MSAPWNYFVSMTPYIRAAGALLVALGILAAPLTGIPHSPQAGAQAAEHGNGNGGGNGNGNGNGGGNGNGNGNGGNNGNGGGSGNNGNGNGNGGGGSPATVPGGGVGNAGSPPGLGGPPPPGLPADPGGPPDQTLARDAVESQRALPLENILGAVREVSDGKPIDARLIEVGGFLLYEVRVLEADGRVRRLYYYAKSGLPVERD